MARAITIGSIVFTVLSLVVAVIFARKRSRIRIGFDLARALVGVAAILVMAAVTGVTTPGAAIALAIAVGLGLGFAQGSSLEITSEERGFYSKRSPVAIALWGAGIVIMQAAGLAARTGTVQVGQTIAWFSACLGIGLMVGRNGPLQNARQAVAGAGVTGIVAALVAPALISGTATPAAAKAEELTNEQVCGFVPVTEPTYPQIPGVGQLVLTLGPVANATAGCVSSDIFDYTGQPVEFVVYLFGSSDQAESVFNTELMLGEEWFTDWAQNIPPDETYDPSVDYNRGTLDELGVVGSWWSVGGVADRVAIVTGPFLLYGVADNLGFTVGEKGPDGYREPVTMVEELVTPMVETVRNIEAFLATTDPDDESSPPPPVDDGEEGDDVRPGVGIDGSEGTDASPRPAGDADEPVTPEEAAAQAIAGLIAAAAMGVITWAEAAAEIGRILAGGPLPPTYTPTHTRTTVVLTGTDAEAALSGGVGTNVPIPGEQQWDQNVSVPDGTIRTDPVGSRGVVSSVGPIVRGPDGEISISVEVDPPPPPPPPPGWIELDPIIGPEPDVWPSMPRRPPPLDPDDDTLTPEDLRDPDFRKWLDDQRAFGEKVAGWHAEEGAMMDWLHLGGRVVYGAADMSIHLLANLTGPLGQGVKEEWNIAKHLARGTGRSLVDGEWSENMLRSGTEYWVDRLWSKGFDWLTGKDLGNAPGLSNVPIFARPVPGQIRPRLNLWPSEMSDATAELVRRGTGWFAVTRGAKINPILSRDTLKDLTGLFDWSPPWPDL